MPNFNHSSHLNCWFLTLLVHSIKGTEEPKQHVRGLDSSSELSLLVVGCSPRNKTGTDLLYHPQHSPFTYLPSIPPCQTLVSEGWKAAVQNEMNTRLNGSQQCSLVAKRTPCTPCRQVKAVISPLHWVVALGMLGTLSEEMIEHHLTCEKSLLDTRGKKKIPMNERSQRYQGISILGHNPGLTLQGQPPGLGVSWCWITSRGPLQLESPHELVIPCLPCLPQPTKPEKPTWSSDKIQSNCCEVHRVILL